MKENMKKFLIIAVVVALFLLIAGLITYFILDKYMSDNPIAKAQITTDIINIIPYIVFGIVFFGVILLVFLILYFVIRKMNPDLKDEKRIEYEKKLNDKNDKIKDLKCKIEIMVSDNNFATQQYLTILAKYNKLKRNKSEYKKFKSKMITKIIEGLNRLRGYEDEILEEN